MTNPTAIYPNTTPAGETIPDAILNPVAARIMNFTTAAQVSATALFDSTDDFRIVQLYSNEDCLIGFNSTPVAVPTEDAALASSMLILADIIYQLQLPKLYISAVGLTASGKLYINSLTPWNALGTQTQIDRQ